MIALRMKILFNLFNNLQVVSLCLCSPSLRQFVWNYLRKVALLCVCGKKKLSNICCNNGARSYAHLFAASKIQSYLFTFKIIE